MFRVTKMTLGQSQVSRMSKKSNTVMIVDDEPMNHALMERILEVDYDLVSANSGEECLKKLGDNIPDVILLDIMMPGLSGYDVCEIVKSDPELKGIPVIFVSADDTLEARLKGYEFGAEDYFIKPINKEKLLDKVRQVLDYQQAKKQQAKSAEQASQVAMQALTATSDLGVILRFLQNSFTAKDYDRLTELLFEAFRHLGLDACIQMRTETSVISVCDGGASSPLEESILQYARNKGRILDSDNKTIFNHQHITMMIKNMPLDDEIRYGNIKDNMCFLLDGAEARIIALQSELELQEKRDLLVHIIQNANQTMEKINVDLHQLRLDGATIVEDMMERMDELVPLLALKEDEEKALLQITEKGIEQTTALFSKGIRVDEKFVELIQQLYGVVHEEKEMTQLAVEKQA